MRSPARKLGIYLALFLAAPWAAAEPGGFALSFASARYGTSVFEPRVEIGRVDLAIRAGDALEFDLLLPAPCAERAGVEIVLADGRRSEAPLCTADALWHRVRVPLDAFAGAAIARVELVARGKLAGEIGFRVDDVVVAHAGGAEPTVVFRDALPGGVRIVRDDMRRTGAALVPVAAGWEGARTLLADASLTEPWSAYDLTNLRRSFESEGRDVASPRGDELVGPCVPMRFARAGQSAFVRATGQRLSFHPVEGGRDYTVWIAASLDDGPSLNARAFAFSEGGERRAIDFSVPAAGSGNADALDLGGCFLIEVPVASVVPLLGIQLPDERRMRIHAISFQWRRDGANASSFRLAWIAREAALDRDIELARRMGLARYVRNRTFGPLFLAPAPGEEAGERALFEALLAGDKPMIAALLRERLGAQSKAGEPLKTLRVAVEDVRDGRGTLHVFGDAGAPLGAEELVRAVQALPARAAAIIDGDLAELRQAPQLLRSGGVDAALVPSSTPIARWTGPESSGVQLAGAFDRIDDMRQFGDLPWRAWIDRAVRGETAPELFVPVGGADASRVDAAALVVLLASLDVAPRARSAGAEEFVAEAVKRLGTALPTFTPGDLRPMGEGDASAARESTLQSRRAAAAIGVLQTFGTIARADGAPASDVTIDALWRDPATAVDRARDALHDQLVVLARGATTLGEGTPIVAFNPLPWPRRTLITLETPAARLVGSNGKSLPSQPTAGGGSLFALEVPALGYEVLHGLRVDEAQTAPRAAAPARLVVDGFTARNDDLAFTIDPRSGAIASLKALPEGLEMLSEPARLSGEGWVVQSADFVERGPLRAVARIELATPAVRATIELVLAAHARVLEVRCTLTTVGTAALPVFDLPMRHAAPRAIAGVPFGSSPAGPLFDGRAARHRLLDWMLSTDGSGGVAVLAGDCATALVAPRRLAVEMLPPQSASSPRTTTFALAPFAGGWKKVGLSQCAQELAVPVELLATDAHAGARGNNHAFVSIARVAREGPLVQGPESGVMLSALQSTTDGGCLLRVVETAGQVEDVVIEFDRPVFAAQRVDLRGAPLGVLRYEQGRVYITLGSQRIENVLVKLRP